jgi:uncharacterized protein YaeQ
MAPNATIFKALLHIADVDRHYYEDHTVTLARIRQKPTNG